MVILCSHKKTKHKTLGKVTSPVVSALRRLRQEERDLRVHSQPMLPPMVTKQTKSNNFFCLLDIILLLFRMECRICICALNYLFYLIHNVL